MRPTFIHDNSLAAVGFTELLSSQLQAQWRGNSFVHVVSRSMPCSKLQYDHMVSTPGYSAGACVVLESMPANSCRAKLRVKEGRIFIINARLSLPEMRLIARYIISYLSDFSGTQRKNNWQVMWEIVPLHVLRSRAPSWLTRNEQRTLRYLLAGYPMKTIAAISGLNIKTISRYKHGLMHKLNVFSRAELHFRICMEKHILQPEVGKICKVNVPVKKLSECTETHPINLKPYLTIQQAACTLEAPEIQDGCCLNRPVCHLLT